MSRARVAPTPAPGYPPGYFCQPVLAWRQLGHTGEPQPEVLAAIARRQALLRAWTKGRATSAAKGVGWGDGTMVMPGTPRHLPPGTMQPAQQGQRKLG